MKLSQDELLAQLTAALSPPLSDPELAELRLRLSYLEEQVAVLRSTDLRAEAPSLPPSLEEQP